MRTAIFFLTLLILLAISPAGSQSAGAEVDSQKPFFDARKQRTQYAGPGREASTSEEEIEEVLIGYFGPDDPDDPVGGDLWKAAQLALSQANQDGGYHGKPFRLVPAWSENPWGTGVKLVARLAYDERVWAIIGGIDGPTTHLAEQVVAKARLPLVSPVSTDKTVNLANVPWMFSLAPGDHLLAPVLAAEIVTRTGNGHFVIVSADDHDSRLLVVELKKALTKHRAVAKREVVVRQRTEDLDRVVGQLVQVSPDVAVIIADANDSARLVSALRSEEFTGPILGGPAMGRRQFLEEARDAAEGVVFPMIWQPNEREKGEREKGSGTFCRNGPEGAAHQRSARQRYLTPFPFVQTFRQRHGHTPDYAAAHMYDAVNLLIEAIRRSGLNRARIGDGIRELSPWNGVTGTVRWDGLGSNTRPARLATMAGNRVAIAAAHPDRQALPRHSATP
jgi:ABC-type branched-subunit amino acid transport system substrate-binding protein